MPTCLHACMPEHMRQERHRHWPACACCKQEPRSAAAAASPTAARAVGGPGPSEALKAANRALVDKIKRQLSADAFGTFRDVNMQYSRGAVGPDEFHGYMVSGEGAAWRMPGWRSCLRAHRHCAIMHGMDRHAGQGRVLAACWGNTA